MNCSEGSNCLPNSIETWVLNDLLPYTSLCLDHVDYKYNFRPQVSLCYLKLNLRTSLLASQFTSKSLTTIGMIKPNMEKKVPRYMLVPYTLIFLDNLVAHIYHEINFIHRCKFIARLRSELYCIWELFKLETYEIIIFNNKTSRISFFFPKLIEFVLDNFFDSSILFQHIQSFDLTCYACLCPY